MLLLRSVLSNFASVETIALHIGEVPAPALGARRRPAPGPAARPDWGRARSSRRCPSRAVAVEARAACPAPFGEVRTACVAQINACLLEEEVAAAAAATRPQKINTKIHT